MITPWVCLCLCISTVISPFKSLGAVSQVFAPPHSVSLCNFAYYVVG